MKNTYTAEELRDRFPEICGGKLPTADVVEMVNLTIAVSDTLHKAHPRHTRGFFIDLIMRDMEHIVTGHPERAVILFDDDEGEKNAIKIPVGSHRGLVEIPQIDER